MYTYRIIPEAHMIYTVHFVGIYPHDSKTSQLTFKAYSVWRSHCTHGASKIIHFIPYEEKIKNKYFSSVYI